MPRYVPTNGAPAAGITVSHGCLEAFAYAAGTGVAYDPFGIPGCWAITGVGVDIEDTTNSVQHGFERINWNMKTDGTVPPVPTQYSLPGPIG